MRTLTARSHVVVADARPMDYRHLAEVAADRGWHVHLLTSAAATIQFARRLPADLWLVNSRLPDMSGLELVALIRQLWVGATVLVTTDAYDVSEERRACQGGAGLYLGKDADSQIDCRPLLSAFCTATRDGPIRAAPSRPSG